MTQTPTVDPRTAAVEQVVDQICTDYSRAWLRYEASPSPDSSTRVYWRSRLIALEMVGGWLSDALGWAHPDWSVMRDRAPAIVDAQATPEDPATIAEAEQTIQRALSSAAIEPATDEELGALSVRWVGRDAQAINPSVDRVRDPEGNTWHRARAGSFGGWISEVSGAWSAESDLLAMSSPLTPVALADAQATPTAPEVDEDAGRTLLDLVCDDDAAWTD